MSASAANPSLRRPPTSVSLQIMATPVSGYVSNPAGWMWRSTMRMEKLSIYAENKASSKTLEKLCSRLATEFQSGIPPVDPAARAVDDGVMKAHHIWKNRPLCFWGVCPIDRRAYRVYYTALGFSLQPIEAVVPAEGLPV